MAKNNYYMDIDQVKKDLVEWNKMLAEATQAFNLGHTILNALNKKFQDLWEAIPTDAKN